MNVLRNGSRRALQLSRPAVRSSTFARRCFASRIDIPFAPPPFPTIETCPSPTCQCGETPAGLDIEREQNINGSMPAYAEQVLISTGKDDWTSRIEDDEEGGAFVRQIKSFLGQDGKYSNVSYQRAVQSITSNHLIDTHPAIPQCHAHELVLRPYARRAPSDRALNTVNSKLNTRRRSWQRSQHRTSRRTRRSSSLSLPPPQLPIRPEHPHRSDGRRSVPQRLCLTLAPPPAA
jgi:hypothetical protein